MIFIKLVVWVTGIYSFISAGIYSWQGDMGLWYDRILLAVICAGIILIEDNFQPIDEIYKNGIIHYY